MKNKALNGFALVLVCWLSGKTLHSPASSFSRAAEYYSLHCDEESLRYLQTKLWEKLLSGKEGQRLLKQVVIRGNPDCVRQLFLTEASKSVNAVDDIGWSPAMYAASGGHAEVISLLSWFDADFDIRDFNGESPLIIASTRGHRATVKALLDAGANLQNTDNLQRTALMLSAINKHTETVFTLLVEGAPVDSVDINGNTALMYASLYEHTEISELLLTAGADINHVNHAGYNYTQVAQAYPRYKQIMSDQGFDNPVCDTKILNIQEGMMKCLQTSSRYLTLKQAMYLSLVLLAGRYIYPVIVFFKRVRNYRNVAKEQSKKISTSVLKTNLMLDLLNAERQLLPNASPGSGCLRPLTLVQVRTVDEEERPFTHMQVQVSTPQYQQALRPDSRTRLSNLLTAFGALRRNQRERIRLFQQGQQAFRNLELNKARQRMDDAIKKQKEFDRLHKELEEKLNDCQNCLGVQ